MLPEGRTATLYATRRCRACGLYAMSAVDLNGQTVCNDCLRRLDADPVSKRNVVLGFGELGW